MRFGRQKTENPHIPVTRIVNFFCADISMTAVNYVTAVICGFFAPHDLLYNRFSVNFPQKESVYA